MKIRIVKDLFGGPAHSIKAGTELYGRVIEMDPLCKMFQCTNGEYSGREIPFKFYIEIPEDKTFSELRVIELEQENLQRLEEVKGLQRQVESLTEFSNQKVKDVKRLSEETNKAWAAYAAEVRERLLLEATLERAMLDYQPEVLPKDVADEMVKWRNNGYSNFEIIGLIRANHLTNNPKHLELSPMSVWADRHQNPFMRALADGYTVKLELPIAYELADMIHEWNNEPTFDDEDAACLALATRIAERTKEFYSKN